MTYKQMSLDGKTKEKYESIFCAVKCREILFPSKSFFFFLTEFYAGSWVFVVHLAKNLAIAIILRHFPNNVVR